MMERFVHIVSGLPRSGTSMMMRALEAGGLSPLVDGVRAADEDNPAGYYELERVKQITEDVSWLEAAEGKVVKLISRLLPHLPPGRRYKVVFMRRDLDEVLRSQARMLERRGEPPGPADGEMKRMFMAHLAEIEAWLAGQPHLEVLYVSYNRMVSSPREQAERVNRFLGDRLDVARMILAVDESLYRQRKRAS
jgi:hypothetical protein